MAIKKVKVPALGRVVHYNHNGQLMAATITDPGWGGQGSIQQLTVFPPGSIYPFCVHADEGHGYSQWQWPAYVPDLEIEVPDNSENDE